MESTNTSHDNRINAMIAARKLKRAPFLSAVRELRLQNFATSAIGKKLGISPHVVNSCLKDLGLDPLSKSDVSAQHIERRRNAAKDARNAIQASVKELFDSGYPVLRIAKTLSVSRGMIYRTLSDMGINTFGVSEGNRRSAAFYTPQERKDRAKSAHESISRNGRTEIDLFEHAIKEQSSGTYIGFGEREIAKELSDRGFSVIPQFAWKRYNIDIMVGNVAVEIHVKDTDPIYTTQTFRRLVELRSAGYHVIYLKISPKAKVIKQRAIDQIVNFINFTSGQPSSIGQYRMITGDGEISLSANRKFDEIADVMATYCSLNTNG